MNEQQKYYVTDEDIKAVAKLQEYYRRQVRDWTTDETFMQWMNEVMNAKRTNEYQQVKQVIENDQAFRKRKTEFIYSILIDSDGVYPPEFFRHNVIKTTNKYIIIEHDYIGKKEVRKLSRLELETKGETLWVRGSSHVRFCTEEKKKRIEEFRIKRNSLP